MQPAGYNRRMTAVTLRDLTKLYPASRAGVRGVSLEVAAGEHFVLVGPSGAGKTTILRLIAGLERPDAGQVLIAGRDVSRSELDARVTEAARLLGLTGLLDRQPRHLSGGEQQRVALGRAWVAQAGV